MRVHIDAYDVCRRFLDDLEEHHASVNGDLINRLRGWLRSRSLAQLADAVNLLLDVHLHSIEDRRVLMQVAAFFSKNASLTNGADTQTKARERFFQAEERCKQTNQRLDRSCGEYDANHNFIREIATMQEFISSLLGPIRSFADVLPKLVRFTYGASSTQPRRTSAPHNKVSSPLVVPPAARNLAESLLNFFGVQRILSVTVSLVNRVVFVPKNWKTDRTIACEGSGALPLQLAFDRFVKSKLRKISIDLSDQSRNQGLAKIGSMDGSLATIDLSMASDCLAFNTVALLFPYEWFRYLASIRSSCYDLDGQIGWYYKFSSMGNGSTFGLETLIFAAACHSVGSRQYSVYGDDIIIESELAPALIDLLGFLGFDVNKDKTYLSGPFRESCGSHYHEGIDITPFYLQTDGVSKMDLCHIVNNLASVSIPGGHVWELLRSIILEARLPLVPFNERSDSGIWIDIHDAYRGGLMKYSRTHHCVSFKAYVEVGQSERITSLSTYQLWHLQSHFGLGDGNSLTDKGFWRTLNEKAWISHGFVAFEGAYPTVVRISSSVPSLQPKRVRKWVHYIPYSAARIPTTLYAWSDYILTHPESEL